MTSDRLPQVNPKRRWLPRYSLRTLLLFVLLVNSACLLWVHWAPWEIALVIRDSRQPRQLMFVAWSDDGKRLYGLDLKGNIEAWNSETGEHLGPAVFPKNKWIGTGSEYRVDGKRLVYVIGSRLTLSVRDGAATFRFNDDDVIDAEFSPDGNRIALGNGNRVEVWRYVRPEQ